VVAICSLHFTPTYFPASAASWQFTPPQSNYLLKRRTCAFGFHAAQFFHTRFVGTASSAQSLDNMGRPSEAYVTLR
jgi:hypothetical protein